MRFAVRPCSGVLVAAGSRRRRGEWRWVGGGEWHGEIGRGGGGLISFGCRGDGLARTTRAAGGRSGWQRAHGGGSALVFSAIRAARGGGWWWPPWGEKRLAAAGLLRRGVAWRVRRAGGERGLKDQRPRVAFAALRKREKAH
jgi:hypothetical protein